MKGWGKGTVSCKSGSPGCCRAQVPRRSLCLGFSCSWLWWGHRGWQSVCPVAQAVVRPLSSLIHIPLSLVQNSDQCHQHQWSILCCRAVGRIKERNKRGCLLSSGWRGRCANPLHVTDSQVMLLDEYVCKLKGKLWYEAEWISAK